MSEPPFDALVGTQAAPRTLVYRRPEPGRPGCAYMWPPCPPPPDRCRPRPQVPRLANPFTRRARGVRGVRASRSVFSDAGWSRSSHAAVEASHRRSRPLDSSEREACEPRGRRHGVPLGSASDRRTYWTAASLAAPACQNFADGGVNTGNRRSQTRAPQPLTSVTKPVAESTSKARSRPMSLRMSRPSSHQRTSSTISVSTVQTVRPEASTRTRPSSWRATTSLHSPGSVTNR